MKISASHIVSSVIAALIVWLIVQRLTQARPQVQAQSPLPAEVTPPTETDYGAIWT